MSVNFVSFGIGATIRTGQEIECLPYTVFLIGNLQSRGSQVDNQRDRHPNLLAGGPIFFGGGKKNCGMGVQFFLFYFIHIFLLKDGKKRKMGGGSKKSGEQMRALELIM